MTHVIAEKSPGKRVLLTGNEAIARGAIEAGVKVAAAYPGSPSTQIMETLLEVAPELRFHAEWSANEKVAFEVAGGAALVGMRGFACMKNAGLLWCADMLMTITYGGVRGGFVIGIADDPAARISSSAHDSRFTGMDAEILILEPATHQEAKDMTKKAFEYSESLELPVMMRSQYRLSYSSGDITFGEIRKEKRTPVFDKHWKLPFRWNIYGFSMMNEKHGILHSKIPKMKEIADKLHFTKLEINEGSDLGIIASGVGATITSEVLEKLSLTEKVNFLKTGTAYPIPEEKTTKLFENSKKVLVIEDGEPVVELQTRALAQDFDWKTKIYGKSRNAVLPDYGDLDILVVERAISQILGLKTVPIEGSRHKVKEEIRQIIIPRSLQFCAGCPHIATWWAIRMAVRKAGKSAGPVKVPIINGDIGCYEQAGFGITSRKEDIKPSFSETSVRYDDKFLYELIDTNAIMGGGVGFAQGQYWAGYRDGPIIAVMGDSTFYHASIPALINMVWNGVKTVIVIFDNSWTAMTGHQPHPGTGMTGIGEKSKVLRIEDICKACGFEFVRIVDPYNILETRQAVEDALNFNGPAVIISRRLCALLALRNKELGQKTFMVDEDKCTGCKICIRLGCPAISFNTDSEKAYIPDIGIRAISCSGCGVCSQVCPVGAIVERSEK